MVTLVVVKWLVLCRMFYPRLAAVRCWREVDIRHTVLDGYKFSWMLRDKKHYAENASLCSKQYRVCNSSKLCAPVGFFLDDSSGKHWVCFGTVPMAKPTLAKLLTKCQTG